MGANQSARKVTVVQDESTGVIKISDSVVQRLKGEISGEQQQQQSQPQQQQQQQAPPPTPPPPPPPVETHAPPPPVEQPPAPAPALAPAPAPQVWQPPVVQIIEEPSISALRVRAEKEEEMKTTDDYWRDKLQRQEVRDHNNRNLT